MSFFDTQNAKTAFDELRVEQGSPITQIGAQYGLLGQVLTVTDSAVSGNNSVVDNMFTCQTGVAATGFASILTLRQVGSRPGQGTISRFDAVFDTAVADSIQAAGLLTSENAYLFGYVGAVFGIAYTRDGVSEVQELKITTAATSPEDATITVNGNPFTVPLTSGSVQHNAFEIANSLQTQVINYNFTSNNDEVVAQSLLPGAQGSFAFSSSTAVAAWTQVEPGADGITTFTPQSEWSVDTRLTGDAARILDPTKGNLYQIQVNSNFGAINFSLEDNESGSLVLVHQIKLANLNITPNVTNPTFRLGWFVQNTGNITNLTVSGSSAGALIEGKMRRNNPPRSDNNNQLAVGTSLTNIMTLRNRITFGGKVNRVEVFPSLLAVSSQANKSTFFVFLADPEFAGDLDFSYIDKAASVMETAKDLVGVSGGTVIGSLVVEAGAPQTLRLNQTINQDTVILPGTILTIAAFVASGASGDMQTTFTWEEDI